MTTPNVRAIGHMGASPYAPLAADPWPSLVTPSNVQPKETPMTNDQPTPIQARKAETVIRLAAIADLLTDAAELVRSEAAWIANNAPLREWSDETTTSYLRSSVISRQVSEVEPRVTQVARIFAEALADLEVA